VEAGVIGGNGIVIDRAVALLDGSDEVKAVDDFDTEDGKAQDRAAICCSGVEVFGDEAEHSEIVLGSAMTE